MTTTPWKGYAPGSPEALKAARRYKPPPTIVEPGEREEVIRQLLMPRGQRTPWVQRYRYPIVMTSEEASRLGFNLETDWMLRITPSTEDVGFLSPEGFEIGAEEIEEEVGIEAPDPLGLFEAVYPDLAGTAGINTVMQWAEEQPEAFLEHLQRMGRTPEVEQLLRAYGWTAEEISGLYTLPFAEKREAVIEPPPQAVEPVVVEIEGIRQLVTRTDDNSLYDINGNWIGYYNWADGSVYNPYKAEGLGAKALASFTAGIGDVLSVSGGAARWMGYDDVANKLSTMGSQLQRYGVPSTSADFQTSDLLNPEFYATTIVRTIPFALSLAPLSIGGFYGGAGLAGAVGLGTIWQLIVGGFAGAALSRPLESVLEAGGQYDDAIARGKSDKEASEEAKEVFINNMKLAGMDAFQIAIALAPTPKWVPAALVNSGLVRTAQIGGKMVIVGLTEGGEEVYQDMIQRHARGEEWQLDPVSKEVFAIGMVMGLGMGLGGDVISGIVNKAKTQMPTDLKGSFDLSVQGFQEQGFKKDEAELKALDEVAQTPEGEKFINKIIRESKPEVPTVPEVKALTEDVWNISPVEDRASWAKLAGLEGKLGSKAWADLTIGEKDAIRLAREEIAPTLPEVAPPVVKEVKPPEVPTERERIGLEVTEMQAEVEGLKEWLATEPAAKLVSLIKRTGWYKGEISNLTTAQYKKLTGKAPLANILTADKKHVRWEYALDDIATEMGYESSEALRAEIERAGETLATISKLEREIRGTEVPAPEVEITPEVAVKEQLTAVQKVREQYREKIKTYDETKKTLVDFVKAFPKDFPLEVRGKLLASVARVKTEAGLEKAVDTVSKQAEQYAQKVLRKEITKEIKKTQAKVKQHILTGKFTPETQRMLDTIRHNLNLPRAQALDKVASNFDQYNKGEISWEEMHKENEALNFVGIKEMTSQELIETLDYIKVLKELGRSERQAKREVYIEEITSKRQDIIDTASGGKGSAKGVYAIPKSEWQATQSFLDKVINWMYNWDSILDKISKFKRDLPFKSPISIFGARVHRARHLQHSIQQEAQATAIKALEGIYKTKNRHQLNRILSSWKHEIVNLGEFKLADIVKEVEGVEVVGEGVFKTIRMTKGQMMTMYNLMKDPTLDSTFRNTLRWTDKIMDAVRNNLTVEEKAYADWAMDFFKNDPSIGYDAINAVYSDIYAVDLNDNPFYFPAFRDMESEIHEEVLTFREARDYASVLNGSLKVRVPNIRALKFSDITDVISSHITKQAHFIAWGHTMRDMRAVFGNKEVRETIEQYHGAHIMQEITKNLNDMARDGVERQQFGFIADYLRANFTKAILGVKGALLLKQIPSVLAYMTEMPMGDFVVGVQNYWHSPVENYRLMLKHSPYLRERFGAGFERDVHFANMKKPADFLSGRKPVKGYITENVKFGDKFAVVQGMWAKMQSELKGMGVTIKTATEAQITEAMQAAEDVTNRTQPAFDIETLAPLQRGGPWVKLLTMFQTQPGQYFRIIGNNFRNFQYHRGTRTNAVKNMVLVWIVLPCLWQLIADGFQWKPEHQYRAMILGQLNWILIVSQLSRSAYDWAVGEPFDYMASPVMASVRDFLFGIGKVRKIALQGKDPYVDISMDDVIGAVEFFGKAVGQVTGYPTPFLVQVERAQREYIRKAKEEGEDIKAIEVGKRVIFSAWALEPPKQNVRDKAREVSDKLGELIKEVDEVRAEYGLPGEYYGMTATGSKFRGVFAHTLLSDITEDNGFDKLAVAWAEMETARQTHADLLPNVSLYEINTDPMEGLTIVKLHQLWEARSRLTRLPEIVEFDKTWSDIPIHHGNVTRQQLNLLMKYLETPDEEKKQFVEDHPELKVNPRNEWLKSNPIDNARLALWGQAKILSKEAYDEFNRLVRELDIPDDAIPDGYRFHELDKSSAENYFKYQDVLEQPGMAWNSWESQIIWGQDDALREFLRYDPIETPVRSLELKIKHRSLYEQYDLLETDEDRAKLKADNPEWVADMRRIEAIENEASDEIIEKWVDRGHAVDQFSAGSSEAMVWLLDNPEVHKWALDKELLTDDGSDWNEPVLRINAKWREQDEAFDAIDGEDQEARQAFLARNEEYRKDRRRREAFGNGFPEDQIENFVDYWELPVIGYRQERYLIEHPELATAMEIDLPEKVPSEQYDILLEKGEANWTPEDELRMDAYKLYVPDKHINSYVEYYSLSKPDDLKEKTGTDLWYEDDWWMMEHKGFYQEVYLGIRGNQRKDYRTVPTRAVFAKYLEYLDLPLGDSRVYFRSKNTDLDDWLVIKFGYTSIEEREELPEKPEELPETELEKITAEMEEKLAQLRR